MGTSPQRGRRGKTFIYWSEPEAWAGARLMPTAQRDGDSSVSPQVRISNTAINMISSLHHADKERVDKTIQQLTFTVKDQSRAEPLKGLENSYVARWGDLRVIFKREGTCLVIESVVKRG